MSPSPGIVAKKGVVLLQLGGPDSLEAVEPFLYNLFSDPDIFDLPGAFFFRRPLARFISSWRAPKIEELYKSIGGRSPILKQTRRQAESVRKYLADKGEFVEVEIAMRYWHPLTEETLDKLTSVGVEECVLLPLYPHFSKATTGSSIREWHRIIGQKYSSIKRTKVVEKYYDHPKYIGALVEQVERAIRRVPPGDRDKVHLVFSAHGTPMKLVREGDPYSNHIRKTYELVVEKGKFGLPHHLCFQSRVGPQKWLDPSLTDTIKDLARQKVSHVIVNPIAFVSDHIETLSEINIESREEAMELGIIYFDMTPSLIDNATFIECLGELALKELRN